MTSSYSSTGDKENNASYLAFILSINIVSIGVIGSKTCKHRRSMRGYKEMIEKIDPDAIASIITLTTETLNVHLP